MWQTRTPTIGLTSRAIDDELHRDGGLAGLMHVLQTFDLGSVDVYAPPKTAALLEQKEESFPPHVLWWAETLNRGTLRYPSTAPYGCGQIEETSNWPESILKSLVWEAYALWMRQHNIRSRVLTADSLHRWFKEAQLLPGTTTTRSRDGAAGTTDEFAAPAGMQTGIRRLRGPTTRVGARGGT